MCIAIASILALASCGGTPSSLGTECDSEAVVLAGSSDARLGDASADDCSERVDFRGITYDTSCFITHPRRLGCVLTEDLDVDSPSDEFVYSAVRRLKGAPPIERSPSSHILNFARGLASFGWGCRTRPTPKRAWS